MTRFRRTRAPFCRRDTLAPKRGSFPASDTSTSHEGRRATLRLTDVRAWPSAAGRLALTVGLIGCLSFGYSTTSDGRAGAAKTSARHDAARAEILFGLGPEADFARRATLTRHAPVGMLTSWYNGSSDLAWMRKWRRSVVTPAYRHGFALHLVIWDGGPEGEISSTYGETCGRAYALSGQFLQDMRVLARTFAGSDADRLFVTLFAEFQTYPCHDNEWSYDAGTTAYYEALKDQYRAALSIFHAEAPNSHVSLGWGGWQANWDNPAVGGGRSLLAHFADVMRESDFQSFQSLENPTAARDAEAMTIALHKYGPVMLAFYKPPDAPTPALNRTLSRFLSAGALNRLQRNGLFALSFMDTTFLKGRPSTLALVEQSVRRSGCFSCR